MIASRCSSEWAGYGEVSNCIRAVGADGLHTGSHHQVAPYPDDLPGARLVTWNKGSRTSRRVTDVALCPECGTLYSQEEHPGARCLECEFWFERLDGYIDGTLFVIKGVAYARGTASGAFGGHPFHVALDDGREFNDSRTWHVADVPPEHRSLFADNAHVVPRERAADPIEHIMTGPGF